MDTQVEKGQVREERTSKWRHGQVSGEMDTQEEKWTGKRRKGQERGEKDR